MAAGPEAAVERIAALVEGTRTSDQWKRVEQRLSDLTDAEAIPSGMDYGYWVASTSVLQRDKVVGSVMDVQLTVEVELARRYGGGSMHGREFYNLHKDLSEQANAVQQTITHSNNWAFATSGIWLVDLDAGALIEPVSGGGLMIWQSVFSVEVRMAAAHTAVA